MDVLGRPSELREQAGKRLAVNLNAWRIRPLNAIQLEVEDAAGLRQVLAHRFKLWTLNTRQHARSS
jgi:hypothetical protein